MNQNHLKSYPHIFRGLRISAFSGFIRGVFLVVQFAVQGLPADAESSCCFRDVSVAAFHSLFDGGARKLFEVLRCAVGG